MNLGLRVCFLIRWFVMSSFALWFGCRGNCIWLSLVELSFLFRFCCSYVLHFPFSVEASCAEFARRALLYSIQCAVLEFWLVALHFGSGIVRSVLVVGVLALRLTQSYLLCLAFAV